jgi:hypothetical protein
LAGPGGARRLDLHPDCGGSLPLRLQLTLERYWADQSPLFGPDSTVECLSIGKMAHRAYAVYERRPPAESAAIRNAAAMNERLSFGMTALFLNLWIFAVSVSLSRATLM